MSGVCQWKQKCATSLAGTAHPTGCTCSRLYMFRVTWQCSHTVVHNLVSCRLTHNNFHHMHFETKMRVEMAKPSTHLSFAVSPSSLYHIKSMCTPVRGQAKHQLQYCHYSLCLCIHWQNKKEIIKDLLDRNGSCQVCGVLYQIKVCAC